MQNGFDIAARRGVPVRDEIGVRDERHAAAAVIGGIGVVEYELRSYRALTQYTFEFVERTAREIDVPYLAGGEGRGQQLAGESSMYRSVTS